MQLSKSLQLPPGDYASSIVAHASAHIFLLSRSVLLLPQNISLPLPGPPVAAVTQSDGTLVVALASSLLYFKNNIKIHELSLDCPPIACMTLADETLILGTELGITSKEIGSESHIIFVNSFAEVGRFSSIHSDDITFLSFSSYLLSGSTDGLLNVLNPLEVEDDAIVSIIQAGSVAAAGFVGEFIWVRTHMETLAIYSVDGTVLKDYGDVRTTSCEFIIRVFSQGDFLFLLGGTRDGDIRLFEVTLDGISERQALKGHVESVRDFVGGWSCCEGGKICLWE